MLSLKFLEAIKQKLTAGSVDRLSERLSTLNPDKMYLENIRYVMSLPHFVAKSFCDIAVHVGILVECMEYQCPQCGKVIADSCNETIATEHLVCSNCLLNELDVYEFNKQDCDVMTFYKAKNNS